LPHKKLKAVFMIINNITIKNFRGFKDKYFEFDPHVNVVLGDNTTGKTSLLHAVQIALGLFLRCFHRGNQTQRKKENNIKKSS
jgi:predicted ATP-dependent endonuclease of OLD family